MDTREHGLVEGDVVAHWYYRAKAAALLALLRGVRPRTVLDVGAGSGVFSRALLRERGVDGALCVDPAYDADRDEELDGKPLRFRRSAAAPRTHGPTSSS